jgi:diguanylate cyclase (GGDEF)-like protein
VIEIVFHRKVTILKIENSTTTRINDMSIPSTEFFRMDPLTGCNNFLSFVETLSHLSPVGKNQHFSILYIDMNYLEMLNETMGFSYGDSAIRWMEIVLREESNAPTYRTGGDEFTVLLTNGTYQAYEEILDRIFTRLNKEGKHLGIPEPVARIALVHYDEGVSISLYDVLFQLGEAMMDVKIRRKRTTNIYWARNLMGSDTSTRNQDKNGDKYSQETLRWIAKHAIRRVLFIGRMLDDAQKTSLLDSISGLPNMRAALLKMDQELSRSISSGQPFSILLMDGDNLTLYNNISYAAGDEMIQNLSAVLSENLRPGDFIARWRTGDEFIAVLPNTTSEGALIVGDRFCSAIRETSQAWRIPTSISIGIATFPRHGKDTDTLVDVAESAMKKAKDMGKDRVILADQ